MGVPVGQDQKTDVDRGGVRTVVAVGQPGREGSEDPRLAPSVPSHLRDGTGAEDRPLDMGRADGTFGPVTVSSVRRGVRGTKTRGYGGNMKWKAMLLVVLVLGGCSKTSPVTHACALVRYWADT